MTRDELLDQLLRAQGRFKRLLMQRQQGCPVPLAQRELLSQLWHRKCMGATELAKQLHITPGACTQQVDALVRAGLVERQANSQDARRSDIALTAQGHEAAQTAHRAFRAFMAERTASLSNSELQTLVELLQKMTDEQRE